MNYKYNPLIKMLEPVRTKDAQVNGEEAEWKTISGHHVAIGENGEIVAGGVPGTSIGAKQSNKVKEKQTKGKNVVNAKLKKDLDIDDWDIKENLYLDEKDIKKLIKAGVKKTENGLHFPAGIKGTFYKKRGAYGYPGIKINGVKIDFEEEDFDNFIERFN